MLTLRMTLKDALIKDLVVADHYGNGEEYRMDARVRRIFVEKKKGFDIEAAGLCRDLRTNLDLAGLEGVRIINRYDVSGISDGEYAAARSVIFSEPPADEVYDEEIEFETDERVFAVEYLPGQYDQRADSASQCIQMLTRGEKPECRAARLIAVKGELSEKEFKRIKEYCINPVDSHEADLAKPDTLDMQVERPGDVKILEGFMTMDEDAVAAMVTDMGLAMSAGDLAFCRDYFRNEEKREPTITELRLIDTYWSDHCRHTTFLTEIEKVEFEDGPYSGIMKAVYESYLNSRKLVYGDGRRSVTLMDLATIAMKELGKKGRLGNLDASDEINACSIVVKADIDGRSEDWLVMFKNETHNHPTEIEPFGGAATCLGGAIRDPLSGRAYVYQAMRVTGSGDPRAAIGDTIAGKLPQRKITTGAAAGYSSYGNQIGLATGQVAEIYDAGYVAKRMEIGAVVGAAPKSSVVRQRPQAGDAVILLGGRTGRDGCGGATGSSKEHTEESLLTCGAEVQKGNPPTERKIQRLFRNPDVSRLIKRCNDFGAGGVSVAIGELADGLVIDLDAVPKKYEGLDGTELAISESQERMAVVVSRADELKFIRAAGEENLEATTVAEVTDEKRLRMVWRGRTIVDINRAFLDTNGVKQKTGVRVQAPSKNESYFNKLKELSTSTGMDRACTAPATEPEDFFGQSESTGEDDIADAWLSNLKRLNVCSQKGLVERFDGSIGAGSVLMPFGGAWQLSPAEGMAAKLPVLKGETDTGTLMSYGFNPLIARWSPFHGALYAVVEAVAKIAAMGGDYRKVRLTLQEYFEKLGKDEERWGKPFSALLGAYYAQMKLGIPAIGGKDSMSGTFRDLNVPPTLVAFAVDTVKTGKVLSTEFKGTGSNAVLLVLDRDESDLPDFGQLDRNYTRLYELASEGLILAAHSVRLGGVAEAISKMCFGNMKGFSFAESIRAEELFAPMYGSIILELDGNAKVDELLKGLKYQVLGSTVNEPSIKVNGALISLGSALKSWQQPLESVFPTRAKEVPEKPETYSFKPAGPVRSGTAGIARPRVFIPVFPGTNCEYDSARAFERAGAVADVMVVRNLSSGDIEETIALMKKKIDQSQIVMLPGGFSAGDEPDGSGKFIATAFRNPSIREAVMELLKNRDGLMLGICNGFQALIKLGLVPYGEIRDMQESSPTLTFNSIGRHMSCMVNTRVASTKSPWLSGVKVGDIHTIAISHGEGRFIAGRSDMEAMIGNGQIATQYVDTNGNASYDIRFNPNGSMYAIEGITSPDGRVLGKMGHSERMGGDVFRNVPGEKDQKLFESGVAYFR